MAYFDNAATTYPKPECVYAFMNEFYRKSGGNAGRGKHLMSVTAGGLIADTRVKVQELLHCPAKQVVFTPTATIALNIIIQGIIADVIMVTELAVNNDLRYDLEKIRYQFDAVKPDFVIVSHASNTIGLVAPVEEIFSLSKKYDAITLIDMAQTAGLVDCNIGLNIFDFAVFAGHKTLYGPTGISGFVMKSSIKLPSVIFGGTGYESANQDMPKSLPEKYEMGTMNILGIAGLNAALKWIGETTIAEMIKKDKENRKRLLDILNKYDFIRVIGNHEGRRYVGIVSCRIDGMSSDSAGNIFSRQGISVRTGLHCAPLAHQFIRTYPAGTIRFSVNYFTDDRDFKELENALDYIGENI